MNAPVGQSHQRSIQPRSHDPAARTEVELAEVEKFMQKLARGGRVDRAGAMATEHLSAPGKRVRARLALEACRIFGVDAESATKWAAAVELLHNATLIHDDIQDGDTTRRGLPTLWATHGVAQAINAGDLMLMLPFLAVAQINNAAASSIQGIVAESATDIVRGQVEELGLKEASRLDLESYLSACRGKTGALMALPIVGAALLGGHDMKSAKAFGESFLQLGVLFQIQDDVIDIFGDKGRKQVGCDVYEGKVSALLVAHLEASPETRHLVMEIINRPREQTTVQDVREIRDLYVLSGALDDVMDMICEIRDAVLGSRALSAAPGLRSLAASLVHMALAPLVHQVSLVEREYAS
jgi:geranylgeranyl diphosphate synthase type I